MSATTILTGSPAQTVAGDPIDVSDSNPVTILVTGLGSPAATAETIDLEISPDRTNWYKVYEGGSPYQVQFGNKLTTKTIFGPGTFRLNKTASTAAAVTAFAITSKKPS